MPTDFTKPKIADYFSYVVDRIFSGKEIANWEWNRRHNREYIQSMNEREEDWNKIYDQLVKTGRLKKIDNEGYTKKYVYLQLFEGETPPPHWLRVSTISKGMKFMYDKARDYSKVQKLKKKGLLITAKGNANYGTPTQVTAQKWDTQDYSLDWGTGKYTWKPFWTAEEKEMVEKNFGPDENSELYNFTKNDVAA